MTTAQQSLTPALRARRDLAHAAALADLAARNERLATFVARDIRFLLDRATATVRADAAPRA